MTDTEATPRIVPDPTDDTIVAKKEGVGAFGLYLAYVVYSTAHSNRMLREDRFFLYGRMLARYSRKNGEKRAAWRARQYDSHEQARQELLDEVERRAHYQSFVALEIVHKPLVVELTAADIESVAQGEAPYARHEGARLVEKAVGKIDDDTWQPVGAGGPTL
jgi:hypothetical protein